MIATTRQIIRQDMGDSQSPMPLCRRRPSYTIAFATPAPIITVFPLFFNSQFSYPLLRGLFVSQYGVCVCTYAVWGNYILHRFLFVSAGNGPAGRGRKRPPPSGANPARFCVHTAEAVGKEKYGRLQKNVPDDVQRCRGCDQCFGERQAGSHQCPAGL